VSVLLPKVSKGRPSTPRLPIEPTAPTDRVRGARENNWRNVDVDIPKRRLTAFTGVFRSGKSSLVFGKIAAES
jgi:hypothetical protein